MLSTGAIKEMSALKPIPHGIVFPLKEDHSGHVCPAHKMKLYRLCQAIPAPKVEPAKGATWLSDIFEEPVIQESQESQESQEEAVYPLATPRPLPTEKISPPTPEATPSPKRRMGRPL